MMQAPADISINGSGNIAGGIYKQVKISGSGKISGSVEAQEVKISGSGKIKGDAAVEMLKVSGSCRLEGALKGGSCKVSGSTRADGPVRLSELDVSGSFSAGQTLTSDLIKISGGLRSGGEVEAEHFKCIGSFHIDGLLNANQIDVVTRGNCYAREIGGEMIRVSLGPLESSFASKFFRWLWTLFSNKYTHGLRTDSIEGTTIYLENTTAKIVRGQQVTIGPNCRIGLVEYAGELHVDITSRVENRNPL